MFADCLLIKFRNVSQLLLLFPLNYHKMKIFEAEITTPTTYMILYMKTYITIMLIMLLATRIQIKRLAFRIPIRLRSLMRFTEEYLILGKK
jgi:hypothetical protein